jgi:hypothetical protein
MIGLLFFPGLGQYGGKANEVFDKFVIPDLFEAGVPYLPLEAPDIVEKGIDTMLAAVESKAPDMQMIFAGSGVGAFWAKLYSQRRNAKCFVMNPVFNPSMLAAVGGFVDSVTGKEIVFTNRDIERYKQLENHIYLDGSDANNVIAMFTSKKLVHPLMDENKYPIHLVSGGSVIPKDSMKEILHILVEAIEAQHVGHDVEQ